MSTAVAMAPSPAPHDRPSFNSELPPVTTSPTAQRTASVLPPPPPMSATPNSNAPAPAPALAPARSGSGSPKAAGITATAHKSSPPSASRNGGGPKIIVKKEPGSPDLPTARHRPRKLDLSKNTTNIVSPATGRPLTARDGGLGIQEVGLACLSPGFVTQDPIMKEQLQRSMSVREHQRQIIESRLQQQSAKGDGPMDKDGGNQFTAKTPGFARKRGAPPGLSIVAPSHEQFANERVIQSAPLGQTFTGRHNPHPLTRHITNQPSNLSNTSHIHHVPANQTNNRLPPIADVLSAHPGSSGHALYAEQSRAPLASPRHPPPPQEMTTPGRPREYKSAEEAQVELAGGRPELLPKLVHYAGQHQPPTPPSPPLHHHQHPSASRDPHYDQQHRAYAADPARSNSNNTNSGVQMSSNHVGSMKRRRAEYEDGSPPLGGNGGRPAPPPPRRSGPFGEGRDSPDTQRAKREEFLKLCERAWDLFHS
ncbi:hypothetical protein QBC38DRAFT_173069 [Podospora fimiseda]|uniref:Uncharacterized protein n=1 Tax=Podospora fimiseda TaxID=252190 RepID=A0AAN7BQL8_9PEZI|nr:hypothetical protein QBC38DRAFT_173069 [Podospora fimiseda]